MVFHVGAPKTGTTYLQSILWANQPTLAQRGVLVPGGRRFAAFHAAQAIREVPWLAEMPPGKRDVWVEMQARAHEWPGAVLLSHEFLGSATAEQALAARRAVAPADSHVVLTVRDYTVQLPALWQEAVKMGARRRLDDYVAGVLDGTKRGPWGLTSLDVVDVLDRWGSDLPPEQVHVVTVPPPGSPPDLLWRRFAEACGIDPQGLVVPERPENTSLGAVDIELVRQVAQHLPASLQPKVRRHEWLRGVLAQQVLAGRRGPRIELSPQSAATVRAWGERTVDELARRGYHVVGDLADLVSAPLPEAGDRGVSPRAVHRAALDAVGLLLARERELTERLAEAESDVQQLQEQLEQLEQRRQQTVRARLGRRARGHDSGSSTGAGAS
jgi:hypothetical protein